jgi:hypothetical protein
MRGAHGNLNVQVAAREQVAHALVPTRLVNVYIEMYIDGGAANMARVLYTKMHAWFARCEFRARAI